jgi:hypothetical protein
LDRKKRAGEERGGKERKKTGAELCQAQFKMGLAKPSVLSKIEVVLKIQKI